MRKSVSHGDTDVGAIHELPLQKVLPDGWDWASLGDVGLVQLGKTPNKATYRSAGEYKIIKFRDVDENGHIEWDNDDKGYVESSEVLLRTLKELSKGDVLVTASAHMSEHIGKKVGIVANIPSKYKGIYVVGEILQIRCADGFEPRWILYYLRSSEGYKAIQRQVHGVHLISSRAKNIDIPIAPPNEQKLIVAEIEKQFSRLDEAVAALKRIKANLKRYKASVLKAAVEGRLTEEWRKRYPDAEPADKLLKRILAERKKKWEEANPKKKYKEPSAPDTSNLPELPKGWVWTTLSQLGELNRGKSKHRPRNAPHLYGGAYPFVQTGDIRNAKGVLRQYLQTYSEAGLKQSKLWPAGTLCITIAANIADTAILGFNSCFPDSIVGFVAEPSHCEIRFVEYFIRTAKKNIERYAPATAQKNINLEILSDIAVPLPPLFEQQFIVEEVERRLSVAEEIEVEIETNLKRAERLRQSILKKAFEGRLIS